MKGQTRSAAFVGFLQGLEGDRAAMATLRRSLGSTVGDVPFEVFRYVAPFTKNLSEREEAAFLLVAALFSLHPQTTDKGSFGRTMAAIAGDADGRERMERRFLSLLDEKEEDLGYHLRQITTLAKGSGVPVNYAGLIEDLLHWESQNRAVQRQWARDFYGEGYAVEEAP